MKHPSSKGTLHLIPGPIATDGFWEFSEPIVTALKSIDAIVCERIRTTRRMIRYLYTQESFDQIAFIEMGKHRDMDYVSRVMELLRNGAQVAVMSEAGMPCIADPGNEIVLAAHRNRFHVKPYVGPGSFMMALMSSGLNGQSFTFRGYLARDKEGLKRELSEMDRETRNTGISQIFMETPYRNKKLFDQIIQSISEGLFLSISLDITGKNELIATKVIKDWKRDPLKFDEKYPAVFILGRN